MAESDFSSFEWLLYLGISILNLTVIWTVTDVCFSVQLLMPGLVVWVLAMPLCCTLVSWGELHYNDWLKYSMLFSREMH